MMRNVVCGIAGGAIALAIGLLTEPAVIFGPKGRAAVTADDELKLTTIRALARVSELTGENATLRAESDKLKRFNDVLSMRLIDAGQAGQLVTPPHQSHRGGAAGDQERRAGERIPPQGVPEK